MSLNREREVAYLEGRHARRARVEGVDEEAVHRFTLEDMAAGRTF